MQMKPFWRLLDENYLNEAFLIIFILMKNLRMSPKIIFIEIQDGRQNGRYCQMSKKK